MPQVGQCLLGCMSQTHSLLFFAFSLWHLGYGEDKKHQKHHRTYCHVRVADDSQVVNSDIRLLHFRQCPEQYVSSGISLVGNKLWQYDERSHAHTTKRSHGIECLSEVESLCRGCLVSERENEWVGCCFEESQPESKDVKGYAEERKTLHRSSRYEKERPGGIKSQSEHYTFFIIVLSYEKSCGHCHGGIPPIESELHH